MNRDMLAEKIEFLTGKRKEHGLTCFEESDLNKLKGGLENGKNNNK